ncbi:MULTISPECIES: CE1759 family FMN reductase [unclassified Streptomyces]|uniref:CE1759 family FMN reductase n=1 Tax=unclassified Streptomyces TaxID=2593676 RepID=UPI00136CD303|nr:MULTISPECIES: CE1759 family FMN reductase [unclassified Streptomyces]MCW5253507.1 NAD(P)H-dependent oxidoreductase [Streptomyces sp. SHP 1-2]MYU24089.1 NADPH-dependent FMN reductase [Streptomyces sp. SID8352]
MTGLVTLSSGLRQPSSTRLLADRLESATRAALEAEGRTVDATMLELRPLGHDIMDAMLTGFPSERLEAAFGELAGADAVIAVTPAFNASFSGLFKSFFDVLPEETLADMPVLIGATGGTERHSLVLEHALRPMFSYLHAIVSPRGVYAATDDFGTASAGSALAARVDAAAADFTRLIAGCGPRTRRSADDEDLTSMRALLGG